MDGEQKRLACVIRHLQKFDWDNEKAREVSHTVCPRTLDQEKMCVNCLDVYNNLSQLTGFEPLYDVMNLR